MASIYLGIDIGTTSAKCLAVRDDGEILAFAQRPYHMSHPHQDWAEQDPRDYWKALVEVVNRCVSECKTKGHLPDDIKSMAMSTQADTLIVTDASGNPLAPAMSWMDNRAQEQFRALTAETGRSFWYKETGMGPMSVSSAWKIRWIAENRPDLWKRAERFCYVPDFLAAKLTGRFAVDTPSASWTPLFSPLRRDWSQPVLELLGIRPEVLPQVVDSGHEIGAILPEVASELGLSPDAKLVAGAFDQTAAAHGAGVRPGAKSLLSCGTAWVLYAVSGEPVVDDREQIPICCHVSAGEWGMVMPFVGGSAYDWYQRNFKPGDAPAGERAEPPVFIPHLYGGLCPDWRGESRGSLVGLTMAHTWEDVRLALMRGLAFEARRNVEAAERLCGRIGTIRMVGGAGKSDIWPQIIANVMARPVEVSENVESACLGAARLAAGDVSREWDTRQRSHSFEPVAADVKSEQRQYERYLRFYEGLLGLYGGTE